MKTSSFRTTPDKKQNLKDIWGSTSAGATKAVDAYINLRKRILRGLRGKFSKNEMMLLVDHQNGSIFSPDLFSIRDTLIHSVSDAIHLDGLDKKWSVSRFILHQKIKEISDAESYFLREEIDRFWNHLNGEDLESFVDQFVDPYAEEFYFLTEEADIISTDTIGAGEEQQLRLMVDEVDRDKAIAIAMDQTSTYDLGNEETNIRASVEDAIVQLVCEMTESPIFRDRFKNPISWENTELQY